MKFLLVCMMSTSLFCFETSNPVGNENDKDDQYYQEHRVKFKPVLDELVDLYEDSQHDETLFMSLLTLNDFFEYSGQ